jgi:hypothetical protein
MADFMKPLYGWLKIYKLPGIRCGLSKFSDFNVIGKSRAKL